MLASVILDAARVQLQDVAGTRWPDSTLLPFLNEGRRKVVKAKPKAFRVRRSVKMTPGYEQSVPADCAWFFGVVRNLGQDGLTVGASVRRVDREALEVFSPTWADKPGRKVKEFAQAQGEEQTYLIYPPVSDAVDVYAEIELAAFPEAIAADADIGMSDRYETALLYWVLHKVMTAETEEGAAAKAEGFFKGFYAEVKGI